MFWEERGNRNCFSLSLFTFPVIRQKKHETSVRSCNLVNSARLQNLKIMIKMSMTITIMLTAIMVLVFNCFQMYFLISKKQCLSLSKKQKFQKRNTKTFTLFRTKLNVKSTKFQLIHSQSQYQQIF